MENIWEDVSAAVTCISVPPHSCSVSVLWTQPLTTPLAWREAAHSRCSVSSVHTLLSAAFIMDTAANISRASKNVTNNKDGICDMSGQSHLWRGRTNRELEVPVNRPGEDWWCVCVWGGCLESDTVMYSFTSRGRGVGQRGGVIAGILCSYFKEWRVFVEAQDMSKLICLPGTSHPHALSY